MEIVFSILFTLAYVTSECQTMVVDKNNLPVVKVTDWDKKAIIFRDNYWDDKADQIIKQIGKEGFEKVILYSGRAYVPCQMQIFCEDRDGTPAKNKDTLAAALNRLVVYKLATYYHILPSGNKKYYAILSVPFESNKNWDPTAKWETVYFIVPAMYVQE